MPRQVDHQRRREDIAEAVWRLMASQGLEAVTMRHVAAEAGASLGRVQHYFKNKDEMLLCALETISGRVDARISTRIAELVDADEPSALVRAVLIEMLPLDNQRRTEAHVMFAFLARAAVAPTLAAALREGLAGLQAFLVEQIERGQTNGTVSAHRDSHQEAVALLSMIDGLTAHVLVGHHTTEAAGQVFEAHLDGLFGQ